LLFSPLVVGLMAAVFSTFVVFEYKQPTDFELKRYYSVFNQPSESQ